MFEIVEERVRIGEWNEALCFTCPDHPLTEVAVQKCSFENLVYWSIFFISSTSLLTIGTTMTFQSDAEEKARKIAFRVLNARKPKHVAERIADRKIVIR